MTMQEFYQAGISRAARTGETLEQIVDSKFTLGAFLGLNHGNAVQVCVKEPGQCAKYWTTLKDGKSNMHTDEDLNREVYSIGAMRNSDLNAVILHVYVW